MFVYMLCCLATGTCDTISALLQSGADSTPLSGRLCVCVIVEAHDLSSSCIACASFCNCVPGTSNKLGE